MRLRPLTVRVVCPECGERHDVHLKDGYLARAELGESDPSVVAFASSRTSAADGRGGWTLSRRMTAILSSHRAGEPAVDADVLAGDVAGALRGEEGDGRGDLVAACRSAASARSAGAPRSPAGCRSSPAARCSCAHCRRHRCRRRSWCRRQGRRGTRPRSGTSALGSKAQAVEMLMIAPRLLRLHDRRDQPRRRGSTFIR